MKEEHEKNGRSYDDMAVLYRMNAQSRAIEDAVKNKWIDYAMVGGVRFYERAEIKDLMAYLRLLANFRDDVSLRRILNVPKRGIGDTTVEKLAAFAAENGMSLRRSWLRNRRGCRRRRSRNCRNSALSFSDFSMPRRRTIFFPFWKRSSGRRNTPVTSRRRRSRKSGRTTGKPISASIQNIFRRRRSRKSGRTTGKPISASSSTWRKNFSRRIRRARWMIFWKRRPS